MLPVVGLRDACGAGGTSTGVPMCPSGSCPPGSSWLVWDDGAVWMSLEVVPTSHLAMGNPHGTQLWVSGRGYLSGTQPWDTQCGVPGHGAAAWGTSPPAPPKLSFVPTSELNPSLEHTPTLEIPGETPSQAEGGTLWAAAWG